MQDFDPTWGSSKLLAVSKRTSDALIWKGPAKLYLCRARFAFGFKPNRLGIIQVFVDRWPAKKTKQPIKLRIFVSSHHSFFK